MSEPIYEQVVNDQLLNQLYLNVERLHHLTGEVERINEQFRKARIDLRNVEAERKAVMDKVHAAVAYIDLTTDAEPSAEE